MILPFYCLLYGYHISFFSPSNRKSYNRATFFLFFSPPRPLYIIPRFLFFLIPFHSHAVLYCSVCVSFVQVKRDILYGNAPRNRLDLYLPAGCTYHPEVTERRAVHEAGGGGLPGESSGVNGDAGGSEDGSRREGGGGGGGGGGGRPVIVFITGGMWIIGYKAWGALLAQSLMKQGFIVASLDYRNFPQGTVGDMVQDVGVGIGWVIKRAAALGGDPRRVVVIGQSAGEANHIYNLYAAPARGFFFLFLGVIWLFFFLFPSHAFLLFPLLVYQYHISYIFLVWSYVSC